MPKQKPIIIRRRVSTRLSGVAEAARALNVSKQAISNFASGRCPSSLSRQKRSRIKIIDED